MRFLIFLVLLLTGCSAGPALIDDDLDRRYAEAIRDAETAEPSEIVTTLTPIADYNDAIVRRTAPDGTSQIRVVTWTGGFRDFAPGDTLRVREAQSLWVTVVPEVQAFCQSTDLTGQRLDLRLRQRLGLPPRTPSNPDRQFLELWVDPADLARPCPDPDVSDRTCDLERPGPDDLIRVDRSYRLWFDALAEGSYDDEGYPWTRLGYTYDWGRPDGEVGESEFIIRPERIAIVHTFTPTDAYCAP